MSDHVLVLDVGKTHVKVTVLDSSGMTIYSRRASNTAQRGGRYDSLDLEGIWAFFVDQIRTLSGKFNIRSVTTATHGAAAVLLDLEAGAPILPAMDYEFDGYGRDGYAAIRPAFEETLSPQMPMGLNLGRQIHFQLKLLSEAERQRTAILLYPNYWAWRLTGELSAEITSLGCHTDLWNLAKADYSSLVHALGIRPMFPPLRRASEPLATVSASTAALTGLSEACLVYPGMHDSNAGYYPHLATPPEERPTVISTGTWSVAMSPQTPLTSLVPQLDMLANVDAHGAPVATARYLGGREFLRLCEMTNCDVATDCTQDDLDQVIADGVFAWPSFGDGTGPFGRQAGWIDGIPANGKALATLYSALMLDQLLTNLRSDSDIVIEGSFAANDLLCATLAALRPRQRLHQLRQSGGVVTGCFAAMRPDFVAGPKLDAPMEPIRLEGLEAYAETWRARVKASGAGAPSPLGAPVPADASLES